MEKGDSDLASITETEVVYGTKLPHPYSLRAFSSCVVSRTIQGVGMTGGSMEGLVWNWTHV